MSEIDHRKLALPASATIRRAIEAMSSAYGAGMILVVDKSLRLVGVVVDSDIRKGILRGTGLDSPLREIMNPHPMTLPFGMRREDIARFFAANPRALVPLVDEAGRVRGLARMSDHFPSPPERPNAVVLMVGGEGRRLRPLTKDRPKPMLRVGDKPILETILEQFIGSGFRRFYMAVNHKADQIRGHFGDGRRLGAEIRYINERRALGTAGALSLLPRGLRDPLIVMNGDLLTKIDFKALLDYHQGERNLATLCVREYDFQVPFGVVQMEEQRLLRIVEKPTHRFFVNAGIYVVEPKALVWLRRNAAKDMPAFLEQIRRRRPRSIGCFPIREYWIDIGRMAEYQRAQSEYGSQFKP